MTIRRRLPDGTWNGLLCAALTLSHQLEAEMDHAVDSQSALRAARGTSP